VQSGQRNGDQERQPQHDVEHQGGSDGLGRHGKAGIGALDAVGCEQPIPDAGPSGGPARDDVGDGCGRQDDANQLEDPRPSSREQRPGQHGVGHDGPGLERDTGDEPRDVEPAEEVEVLARPHQLGNDQVFDHEKDEKDEQAVPEPGRDDRPPGAGGSRLLRPVVREHLPMLSASAVPTTALARGAVRRATMEPLTWTRRRVRSALDG
jgi:hypothetical protein